MANLSDDDSLGAPENFHITTENDDDGNHWSSYQVKCPLCNYSRKSFHCRFCIRDGNFVHSSHHLAERFAEKQAKYKNLQSVHRAQQATCLQLLEKRKLTEDLQFAIKQKNDNIQLLKQLIEERKRNTIQLRGEYSECALQNACTRKHGPHFVNKNEELKNVKCTLDEEMIERYETKIKLFEELKQCRIQHIQNLIKYIFPLSQRISKCETAIIANPLTSSTNFQTHYVNSGTDVSKVDSSVSATAETLNALAEATHTTYVRGRWILQDSHGELQHVIVAPSLPENGDYSAYNDWVATTKDGVPNAPGTSEAMTSSNSAYRISGALTFTTQLVNLLCFYLDIRLPYKLHYSEFCEKGLNEQTFTRKVAKLNTNILYLCYTQQVKSNTLSPKHTLENLSKLLDLNYSDLGRTGPVETNDCFANLLNMNQNASCYDSDSSSDDEEWETVSHPQHEPSDLLLPPPNVQNTRNTRNMQNTQQTSSVAGGLMTSAVHSVASFWRVFTNGNRN